MVKSLPDSDQRRQFTNLLMTLNMSVICCLSDEVDRQLSPDWPAGRVVPTGSVEGAPQR